MSFKNIILEKDGLVIVAILHRPEVLNALNLEMLQELGELLQEIKYNGEIRVLILTGSGKKAFCSGVDVKESRNSTASEHANFTELGRQLLLEIENLPQVVIAAVNGYALGGGYELVLACDLVIASENAKLGLPEVRMGTMPGWGGTQRVSRLIGKIEAKKLILTGEIISAGEAFRIGMVNEVVEENQLHPKARALAHQIASNAPISVKLVKSAINKGLEMALNEGLAYERLCGSICSTTEDRREGIAAFLQKRKPVFKGR